MADTDSNKRAGRTIGVAVALVLTTAIAVSSSTARATATPSTKEPLPPATTTIPGEPQPPAPSPTAPVPTAPPVTPPLTAPPPPPSPTPPVTAAPPLTTAAPIETAPPVPAGATRVIDQTGRISVDVPVAWHDTIVWANLADGGGPRPTIYVSTDLNAAGSVWTTPFVYLTAIPAPEAADAWQATLGFAAACVRGNIEPFANGRFTGTRQSWTACGGGAATVVQFAATAADGTFSVYAEVAVPTPDEATVAMILDSIMLVPGASMVPVPTAPGFDPAAMPADPTLVLPALPADAHRIVDDTGGLAVSVPATFVERATDVNANDLGTLRPRILASPDLDAAFTGNWSAPVVDVQSLPYSDPASLLATRDQWRFSGCTDAGIRAFDNGVYTGFVHEWTNCGVRQAREFDVVLAPPDQSATVFVYVVLTDADDSPLLVALNSLELL